LNKLILVLLIVPFLGCSKSESVAQLGSRTAAFKQTPIETFETEAKSTSKPLPPELFPTPSVSPVSRPLLTINSAIDWAPPTNANLRAQNHLTVGLWKGTQTEMSPISRFQIVNLSEVTVDQITFEIPSTSSISIVATTCNGLLADGAALAARGRCQVSLRKAAGSTDGSTIATLRYRNAQSGSPSQSLSVRLRLLDETFHLNPVTRRVNLNGRPIDFRGIMLPFPNAERGLYCGTRDANNRCTNDAYYAQKIKYFADRGFNLFIQKIGMTRDDLITVNKNSLRAIAKFNEGKLPEQRVYILFDGQSELYSILTAAGRVNYHYPTMTALQRALLVDNLRNWTARFLEEPLSGYLGLFLADEPETYLEAPNYPILTEARNALRQIEKNHLTMIDLQNNDTTALKNAADIVAHEFHFGDGVNRGTNYTNYILDHLIPDAQGYMNGLGGASLALTHAYGNYGVHCPTAPNAAEYRAIHYAWFFAGVYHTAPFQYEHAGTWKLDDPIRGSLSLFNEMLKLNWEMAAIQPVFLGGTSFTLPSSYLDASVKARSAHKDGKVAIVLFNQSAEWADAPSFPLPSGWAVPAGTQARVFNEDASGTPRMVPFVSGRFRDSARLAPLEARVYVIDL